MSIVIEILAIVFAFGGGVLVGAYNKPSVDASIDSIKAAEGRALTTLKKINDHRSS